MNDQIESATETISANGIVLGKTGTAVVASLAIYGAVSLAEDVVSLAKKIARRRKATEAPEQAEKTPQQ